MDNFRYVEFFTESAGDEAHCVMVNLPKMAELMKYVDALPDDIIYNDASGEYGKELKPHITVLYGIKPVSEEKTKQLLQKMPKNIVASLGTISLFEGAKFDVLKIDVTSPHLTRINKLLCKEVEYNNDYPNYHPHVTLAYLKKGTGKDYVNDSRFSGKKFAFETFIYADGKRNHSQVPMQEYAVGAGGGYGGMAGGSIAANGWAGTPNSMAQQARGASSDTGRVSTMNGNVVMGNSLYDILTPEDYTHPKFSKDEMWTGLRYEMANMEYPDKHKARKLVVAHLESNPKYYSDLWQYNMMGGDEEQPI